jgi:Tfp pilus assembly protein PilO
MSMGALSRRERGLIALAAVSALLVGGYVYVVEPARQRAEMAAELVPAREASLERRRALVAQRERLEAELGDAQSRIERAAGRLLQGPTPPLAASELQKLVKDIAAEAGVEVRSERVLPTADRGGIQEVPIEITVAGGMRETVSVLYQLERTGKLLTLQELKVRLIAVGQPRDVLATLTVSGYLIPSPPAPKPEEKPPGPSKG